MLNVPANLGLRILELAKIAAAMHSAGVGLEGFDDAAPAREALGGAGDHHAFTDEGHDRLLPRPTRWQDYGETGR